MFTGLHIVEYKLNNMEDVENTIFWQFRFWRHHKLVGSSRVGSVFCLWSAGRV